MRADAPATRRSHQAASSTPPATHQPSMAAMTGFESSRRVGPRGPLSRSEGRSRRLAPAENACSSPVSTATRAESSASKARKSSWSRWAVSLLTAFRT